jgi:hypothetical protein
MRLESSLGRAYGVELMKVELFPELIKMSYSLRLNP